MKSQKSRTWIESNGLFIISGGLCLASSGLDGTYMAAWMGKAPYLGYILNTTSDIATLALSYWYGRLRMDYSSVKRARSSLLLIADLVAVGFSWFFSWRQLLRVMPSIEGANTQWVAPIAAAFIPILNAAMGYTQALRVGRMTTKKDTEDTQDTQTAAQVTAHVSGNGREKPYKVCSLCGFTAYSPQAYAGHCKGAEHKRRAAASSTRIGV